MDIKKPSINPAINTIHNLFVLAKVLPVYPPSGDMPISIPNKNMVSPNTINKDPIINLIINILSIGHIVKFNIITSIVIGKTLKNTSLSFKTITFN